MIRSLRHSILMTAAFAAVVAGAHAQMAAPPDPLSITGPDPAARFREVEITQQLDAQVRTTLEFTNESGESVAIADLLGDKPAVLALVYYECPMLCTEILNGLEVALKGMKYNVGDDFNVITVSIDSGETPALASEKKGYYLERLNREGAEAGWHFLTTTSEQAIAEIADTVGFGYSYDPGTDQYAHAAGIMLLTPEGRVSRYYYGIEYIPRDLEFGLIDASKGNIGTVVDKLILLCYAYDPLSGTYTPQILMVMRIMATLVILFFVVFWGTSAWQARRKKAAADLPPDAPPANTVT